MKANLRQRAYNFALRHWKLELFVDEGVRFTLPCKLSHYIREAIAHAWRAGYEAGRAAK